MEVKTTDVSMEKKIDGEVQTVPTDGVCVCVYTDISLLFSLQRIRITSRCAEIDREVLLAPFIANNSILFIV